MPCELCFKAEVTIVDVVDYLGEYVKTYDVESRVITDKAAQVDYDCIGVARGNDGFALVAEHSAIPAYTSGFIAATYKKWFGIDMVYPVPVTPYF